VALVPPSKARELQALAWLVATPSLQGTYGTTVHPLSMNPSSSRLPWNNVRRPWQEYTRPVMSSPAMALAQKSLDIELAQMLALL